jgi:hypothetical protein
MSKKDEFKIVKLNYPIKIKEICDGAWKCKSKEELQEFLEEAYDLGRKKK